MIVTSPLLGVRRSCAGNQLEPIFDYLIVTSHMYDSLLPTCLVLF